MNRTEMIEALVNSALESALADPDMTRLREILQKGFPGYDAMSTAALEREMQSLGGLEFDEPEPGEEFDDDEDTEDEDEDERSVMFASMIALDRIFADT